MDSSNTKEYHKLAISEKENFLVFIYNLGEKGLKQLFRFPEKDFSLWWFSLIAEKPPLKSDCYEKLISFLLTPDQKRCFDEDNKGDIKAIISQIIHGLHYLFYYMLSIIRIKLFLKNSKKRHDSLRFKKYIIVSYFPLIDKTKAAKNIFENRYLAPFHRILDEQNKNEYAHICLQTKIEGYGFREALDLANRFNRHQTLLFLEEFVRPTHLFLFAFYYLYFLSIFIFNLKFIKKTCLYNYKGTTYNIWHILKRDFYNSFCGYNLITSIWFILLFSQLTKNLNKNSKIIAICEMQWWEKALYIFAKKRGITTIGYQHSIVPELILNYFNSVKEIDGRDAMKSCPLPDYLGTVGDITAKLFIKYGWPRQRVFVWGAQRFEYLKDLENFSVPWKDKKDYFVCAFSIDSREMEKLLLLLDSAFKGSVNYKIILKNHPAAVNLKQMINKLNLKLDPNIFEISDESLQNLLEWAKGLIVMESSSCFYALACSIPVIVPRFMNKLDCSPLSYISDIPTYVYSPEEFRQVCEKIINSSESPVSQEKWNPFLKGYLYFPENNNEYLEKIRCLKDLTINKII